ncbi:ATP-binding protein [Actinoplanes sp. HUAS TT8]|uniref:ATP-binding protein n=1 Tax=Actinoplanes sp. HUAS TT8 TaxID=3447453 RepID=UPI003F52509A
MDLLGRRPEQETLDGLLRAVRGGQSRALVLRGEAGCGKTALLDHLVGQAGFARVLRASGVESESEMAYSALQQLCAPLLEHLDVLAEPQRAALSTAFGLAAGPAPERLLVGLAVLGLFAEAARARPLVCVVDDAQWVDDASALILGFVARRLSAESVALVFAARDSERLAALPELPVAGLPHAEARALLDSVLTGPVDTHVRDRIVAETRGNPLALRELPRGLSPAELAFGFGTAGATPLTGRVEDGFQRRIAALPPPARTVLLAAAVEPVGNPALLWRALQRLGLGPDAAAPAEADRLIEFGARVRFLHPLVRSAAWRAGPAAELRQVHAALAEVTDPATDPDRRAWHRAHATAGTDAQVAAELENSAGRALARGGWAAAAAFLERAAELTPDAARRGELLVSAATARADAGAYALVPRILAAAELTPMAPVARARAESLRARVTFMLHHGRAAGPPLLAAARRLRTLDPVAARDTFLMAVGAAFWAGRFGGDDLRVAASAAREGAPPGEDFPDLMLAGFVSWVLDGRTAAVPALGRALDAMGSATDFQHVWLAAAAAHDLFRLDLAHRMTERAIHLARASGALALLPNALTIHAHSLIDEGRLTEAADLLTEVDTVIRETGATVYQLSHLLLAAHRGPEPEVRELFEEKLRDAAARGDGRLHTVTRRAQAILGNGLGDFAAAADAAEDACAYGEMALGVWCLRELVEAAVRGGRPELARDARARLAERTAATPTRSSRGFQAVADALAGPPAEAEARFREAVELLAIAETATMGHRARLLYGEWLREQGRLPEARVELKAAHDAFAGMGATFFAARAARELAAAGERVAAPAAAGEVGLTSQEAAIAQLAVTGRTTSEIATALFLSPRTVEWHLGKVYAKLGINSRRELARTLPAR